MQRLKLRILIIAVATIVLILQACGIDPVIKEELPADNIQLVMPTGWPYPRYDFSTNPLTKEGFILGRKLFYDTKLSRDNTISCASCHQQFAAFSHLDHPLSHGIDGLFGTRNAPGLFNLNWQTNFMWDGGINHIEVQPLAPITNPVEMDETLNGVINKLQNDSKYPDMFYDAFGTRTINSQLMFKAMAQFMGMLVSAKSKYDSYLNGQAAFNSSEQNGLSLFNANCATCHTPPLFTNFNFENNGLDTVFADAGRATITTLASDSGKFKVPSLRNVALSRPYMHDGRFQTLQQVIEHYATGIKHSATLSSQLTNGITLTSQEKTDLINFLKTLSDNAFISDKRFKDPF
jgi:cytochrome c peroxidase